MCRCVCRRVGGKTMNYEERMGYQYTQLQIQVILFRSLALKVKRMGIIQMCIVYYTNISTPPSFPILTGTQALALIRWFYLKVLLSSQTSFYEQVKIILIKRKKKNQIKPESAYRENTLRSHRFTVLFNLMNGRSPSQQTSRRALVYQCSTRDCSLQAFLTLPSNIPLWRDVAGVSLVGTPPHFS